MLNVSPACDGLKLEATSMDQNQVIKLAGPRHADWRRQRFPGRRPSQLIEQAED